MCGNHSLCNAVRHAWKTNPHLTDDLDLYAIGLEAARRRNQNPFLTEAQLGATISHHAEQEGARRRQTLAAKEKAMQHKQQRLRRAQAAVMRLQQKAAAGLTGCRQAGCTS